MCGNSACEQDETLTSCPEDCSVCGDGICSITEADCWEDCISTENIPHNCQHNTPQVLIFAVQKALACFCFHLSSNFCRLSAIKTRFDVKKKSGVIVTRHTHKLVAKLPPKI